MVGIKLESNEYNGEIFKVASLAHIPNGTEKISKIIGCNLHEVDHFTEKINGASYTIFYDNHAEQKPGYKNKVARIAVINGVTKVIYGNILVGLENWNDMTPDDIQLIGEYIMTVAEDLQKVVSRVLAE